MKIRELMTTNVISIGPEAPLKEAARRMIEARVSGLIVTDAAGHIVGMITEADFVKSESYRRANKRALLLRWFDRDHSIEGSRTVADVMTHDVITVDPESDHADAARIMSKRNIKRLPVVDNDQHPIGIITRTDILRAFARPDHEIVDEIENHLMREVLWIDPKLVKITCENGNVVLRGKLETSNDALLLAQLSGRLDGVVSVEDHLDWDVDNSKLQMVPPQPPPMW